MLPGDEARGFEHFDLHAARAVAAAAARIFPSDDLGPGAPEAGVVFYVDRVLAGPERDLAPLYRDGIARLDLLAAERGVAVGFAASAAEVQDAVLAALDAAADPFFEVLLRHAREGMFADPVHGGNRGMVGWRLLGHPGFQLSYGEDDYRPGATIDREPRGIAEFLAGRGR